ncbi:MAG: RrF2 family transcriptional regulator [Acidimicrobiales bacterium]
MTLSKRGDYVVRSALSLARAYPSGEARKIREVVAEMGVPQTFASQILADLVRAGLATSKAGKDGGYRLASPPEQVSLVEVVEAGEGPLRAERCALGEGPCRWDAVCPLHETWRSATEALREVLRSTSLADLVRRDEDIEAGRVRRPEDSHRSADPSVAVADSIQVEAGLSEVLAVLRREQVLTEALAGAFHEVDELRNRIVVDARPWLPVHVVSSASLSRAEDSDILGSRSGEGSAQVGISFEASMPGGMSAHGEISMAVVAVDPERCELRAGARIRLPRLDVSAAPGSSPRSGVAPAGEEGEAPSLGDRLAQVLVRTVLRRLARVADVAATESRSAAANGRDRHPRGSRPRKATVA